MWPNPPAEADAAYAFFWETAEELSKAFSGSTVVGSRASLAESR